MHDSSSHAISPRRRGTRRYISTRLLGLMGSGVLMVGLFGAIGGVAYAINGATQAHAEVAVSVMVRDKTKLILPLAAGTGPDSGATSVPLKQPESGVGDEANAQTLVLSIPGQLERTRLEAGVDAVTLKAADSTWLEQFLARSHFAVLGLCAAVGAAFLLRLLTSIGEGRPFQAGNGARIAGIAGLVAIGLLAVDILPVVAANLVLDRVGLNGSDSPVFTQTELSLVSLVTSITLLLALAEAFRQGNRLVRDVDGLV